MIIVPPVLCGRFTAAVSKHLLYTIAGEKYNVKDMDGAGCFVLY
jgi:hypothetical protein